MNSSDGDDGLDGKKQDLSKLSTVNALVAKARDVTEQLAAKLKEQEKTGLTVRVCL